MATATATRARERRVRVPRAANERGGVLSPRRRRAMDARARRTRVAERGGEHAEEETRTRRFDTASARGVTTFDARTCEAIEFVPIDAWSRDKANFEKLRSMRTFRSAQTVEGVRDDARARAKEKVSARARAV